MRPATARMPRPPSWRRPPTWYLAEGSTSGDFVLFYLLQNPGDDGHHRQRAVPAAMAARRRSPARYTIAARSRLTIPVDSLGPELASTDVSGVVTSTLPIVVERAMYRERRRSDVRRRARQRRRDAPATEWFLAEGATGSFFDLFAADREPEQLGARPPCGCDYLLPSGGTLTKDVHGRAEQPVHDLRRRRADPGGLRPASAGVHRRGHALHVRLNAVPIIVERAMWWPQPVWYEAHNAVGATATGHARGPLPAA